MATLSLLQLAVLLLCLSGLWLLFNGGLPVISENDAFESLANVAPSKDGANMRNIVEYMQRSNKNCAIFYGSQTGTAEDLAGRLAKEGSARYGLKTMVANLADYDYSTLDSMPSDFLALFIIATYGKGEPTDNAVEFCDFITDGSVCFSESRQPPLESLTYVAFGLGNHTYEDYNVIVKRVDQALLKHGATRIGNVGLGDDGAGTTEDDFLAWKEEMWKAVAEKMRLETRETVYQPSFEVAEDEMLDAESPEVYAGEYNAKQLAKITQGPYNSTNPFVATVTESRELFARKVRNCLHIEIDLSGSNLKYETGDHIAVWPNNPGAAVDRFLRVFGLIEKRYTVINIKTLDETNKIPFPSPTTYDAAARYYMEICAPISRQFLGDLANFAPNDESRAELERLGTDKNYFAAKVTNCYLSLAKVLELAGGTQIWSKVPFSMLVEGVGKLQPRYYSISSSSKAQPSTVSITSVVDSRKLLETPSVYRGITTNYLLAIKHKQNGQENGDPYKLNYKTSGPRNSYHGFQIPVHIRKSKFRLPNDLSKPVIMVGPGTGVAPFRAFVQERAMQVQAGQEIGSMVLFFGCRSKDDDFLYEKDWEAYKEILGDKFELITAFSRDGPKKVYVQDRLKENAAKLNDLLARKGVFYVCGDAVHMAREVNLELRRIIAEQRQITEDMAEKVVKSMRKLNQYQVSFMVFLVLLCPCLTLRCMLTWSIGGCMDLGPLLSYCRRRGRPGRLTEDMIMYFTFFKMTGAYRGEFLKSKPIDSR